MARLTWDQAVSDYEKKKQSGNTTTSLPTSGMISWQQAADEYDQHDEEGYKALGQQRISERRQKVVEREERASVSDWVRRYNSILGNAEDYWNGAKAKTLISDFEGIRDAAGRYGFDDSEKYLGYLREIADYYGQFDSEVEYTRWDKYHGKSYSELSSILADMEDGDEKNWLNSYASAVDYNEKSVFDTETAAREIAQLESALKEYNAYELKPGWMLNKEDHERAAQIRQSYGRPSEIRAAIQQKQQYLDESQRIQNGIALAGVADPGSEHYDPEFAAYSGYSSTKLDGLWEKMWSQYNMGYGDLTYEYINNQNGIRDQIRSESRAYQSDTKDSESSYEENHYDYMTADEVSIYNYYYSKHGKEKAEEYLEAIAPTLEQRSNIELVENVSRYAGEHPVAASALSVGTSLLSGQEYLKDLVEYGKDRALGNSADFSTNEAALMTNAARGSVSELVDWEIGNWDAFDFLYSTAMSGADSLVGGVAFGNMGGAVLGLSAAAQGTNDALARGMSSGQAFWNGLFSGTFECIFESVSIGNFNRLKEVAPDSIKDVIKNLGKSMLVNASEETLTEIANIAYDTLINGEFANYTREELENGAWKDALLQVVEAGASGALMGIGMGGIGNAIGYFKGNQNTQQLYGESQQELVGEALEISPDNSFAQEMQARLDSGKDLSGGQLKRLVHQNDAAMTEQDASAVRDAAETRLSELGETGNVKEIANAIAKRATGQKLSKSEQQLISNSEYGEEVSGELSVESVRPGRDTGELENDEYSGYVQAPMSEDTEAPAATIRDNQNVETVRENRTVADSATVPANDQQVTGKLIAEESSAVEEKTVTLEDASKKYGAQAGAMVHTYIAGQDVDRYDKAYQIAYNMGKSGVNVSYAMNSEATSYLTEGQRDLAYQAGEAAADTAAHGQQAKNEVAVNGKKGRRKGTVKGEGVTISDLKQTFNDPQGRAYKYLSTVAEVTGIDIVLYKSEANETVIRDGKAEKVYGGSQGKFRWSEDKIYIDVNAGLYYAKDAGEAAKYAMLRTFAHEFTHFIEKWNPVQYNEFRRVVFDTLTERGENVDDLIEQKQAQDTTRGMTYEQASREVVAEAMTDILPDANFVQALAEKHKSIFHKLLEKLHEFAENLRSYFNSIGYNRSKEANALKEQVGETVKYVDSIVKLFDNVAAQAVENYQQTVAEDKVVEENATTGEVAVSETESVKQNLTPEEQPVVQEEAKEPVTEDVYTKLAAQLGQYNRVDIDGIRYGVQAKKEGGYYGNIKRIPVKAGGVPIENAKGTLYSSYTPGFATREEAVADIVAVARNNKLLDAREPQAEAPVVREKPVKPKKPKTKKAKPPAPADTIKTEEVTPNGETENADNPGAVQQPDADRREAARLLADLEAGDVPGDGAERDAVADAEERGRETGRDDDRDGLRAGHERGHGVGGRERGDLRGPDRVTAEESTASEPAAEPDSALHEEVVEQIAQQSTELPKGHNFVIGESLDLPNGEKSRYKANVDAIRLVKKLEAEGRYATEAEQVILSKYVGWGGLANAFDQRKTDWAKEFQELKELLTDEEYRAARSSTNTAFYTDISIIRAMYDGLAKLGFKGGRILEPAAGVGHFAGAMPADLRQGIKSMTMVELDGITGLIAKYLYPNADVRIQGFEKANIPNDFMDVAVGNVPFGDFPVVDKAYPKKITSAIHNYFFAKTLDKVRPGGIVMMITSSYTMDSADSTVRNYISKKADLLGAIRLPNTAFDANSGTDVVSDILILKKRPNGTAYTGEEFTTLSYGRENPYFVAHPDMILGTTEMVRGRFGWKKTVKPNEGDLGQQIREALGKIEGQMEYPTQISPEKTNFAVERAGKKAKENGLVVKDGKVYKNTDGELVEQKVAKGAAERISGLLAIRDAAKALQTYQQQGLKDSEIRKARKQLNTAYDTFVKKYGFINSPANRNAIKDDPDKFSILALENYNHDTKKATKADIFSKNTIAPNRTVTSAKDVSEGLIVSVNQTGGVDAALIAQLTGKTEEDVTRELLDSRKVFKNRDGVLETAEVYLSGNVRAKLRDAEAMVPMDAEYQKNVDALRAVVPEDVGYQDIFVNPGTPWIPNRVYSDFAAHMLGTANNDWSMAVEVTRNPETGNFTVELLRKYLKTNSNNTQKWGTNRRSFLDLFDAMLNSKSVVVKFKTDDGKSVVDQDATAAANEKIESIQKEFQEWLWKDESRRAELATLYNETFNAIVTPTYNGDNLTVNGSNALKPLRPHQRNAVQRIISSGGNTLLAHKVGAGKTYEMAAAAMKLKQLGLVKKPMFAVPKSLVAQWGNEFMDFFPTAKLLVAEANDFTAANRKVFANRIANGDYDAVILSYEQFERLPISADFARGLYQEQIDSIVNAIEEARAEKGGKSLSTKDLEKKRKQLEAKVAKLADSEKDEDNINFEQLGVDSLFIDEAHNFKNLFYTTSMTNVSGLGNKDGSKRAFDLYTKVRYLQQLNGGRGIVFATATPVMNSMSEMYIMQKYLQPDLLDQLGLSTFDAWAKQFGEVVNGVEIKPSGQGYRVKQSFSRFKNMSELQLLFRNFADVLTEIPGLKIPKMKGGKVNVVVCDPGSFQQDYMKELEKRADNIKNVDPSVDNMLKITSDGRKISYTQRMIDPSMPYEEGCKIFRCADNVLQVYMDSKAIKGTQIIFCDMATPKGKSKTATAETEDFETDMESAKLYDDIKARLMKGGIPAKEIAFIHEADTDAKKKKLFADVNDGKVRVLIGSTGKMGVGMNAQKRIVAIHHLDAPWRPGDVEQRNGRAYRQGNINDEVENFTYVTEGSFDARLWDILERKQNFIDQVMNGENVGREVEDTGEVTLSAAEVKALASGSPLIVEQVQLDTDIKKLESLRRAHTTAVANARTRLQNDLGSIATLEKYAENGRADLAARVDTYSEGKFSVTVGKKTYTDKKEAGIALMAAATSKATEEGYTTIGKFAGFDLRVVKTHEGIKGLISGQQGYSFNTYPGNTTYMINHIIGKVEGLEEAVKVWDKKLSDTKADMEEQRKLIAQPFAKQAELDKKRARYNAVMEILNPKEEQAVGSMDEDTEQHQDREYLNDDTEQNQQRTDTLTDREVLTIAAERVVVDDLTQAEKDALDIFQKRLAKLEALQEERAEQGRLYKEQQFGAKVDREKAAETLARMHTLDSQIQKASADVLSVEEKTVLKRVLQKARKVVEQEQRKHDEGVLKRYRERRKDAAAIKKYRERIQKDVGQMMDWVLKPDGKNALNHIPEALRGTVIPFINSINMMSKRSLNGGKSTKADERYLKHMEALRKSLRDDSASYYAAYELPPNFMDWLDDQITTAREITGSDTSSGVLNEMTAAELKSLSEIVRNLKQFIRNFNRLHANAMFKHVHEAGDSTISALRPLKADSGEIGGVKNFLFWQQIRPAYAFERFGNGGKAIYDGLRRGQSKLAFMTKEIEKFSERTWKPEEVKKWETEILELNLSGDIVRMTVADAMSFYELSKRPAALTHILGDGGRVATRTRKFGEGKDQRIVDYGHQFTEGDILTIADALTTRQKQVADAMQQYMSTTGSKWGNEVSMRRFGIEQFTEEHYFPINVDGSAVDATVDERPNSSSLYSLLNMGFTKNLTPEAKNRIIIYSIFDVFATHMGEMAQYNAMALPVLDAVKWLNYRQTSEEGVETGNVRRELFRVYGGPGDQRGSGAKGYAEQFIVNILRGYNGTEAQGSPNDSLGLKMLHRYNRAQVAFNLSVALKQPTSIIRAGMILDLGSILGGMKNPAMIRKNIEEMHRHSGIAVWKDLGFYDVNISRGLTSIIKQDASWYDKLTDLGLKGAEFFDTVTWAAIWSASKAQMLKKGYRMSDANFYDKVTELFEEVIYKTQVVDSILTKNEYMRDKGFFSRAVSSFMGEPVTSASMILDTVDKFNMDRRTGMNRAQAFRKNAPKFARLTAVYSLSGILTVIAGALAGALRDDDEYQTFWEKWGEAFKEDIWNELNPLGTLPFVSDVWDIIRAVCEAATGGDPWVQIANLPMADIASYAIDSVKIANDLITGEDTNYTWYASIYKMLQAVSGLSGLPMAAATREIVTAWNNIIGSSAPSLKVKTYDPGDKNSIKYAYLDGYLTAEEATAELLEKGLVESEDEAYWQIQEWGADEGYSKYDALHNAVLTGGDIDDALDELIAHGHTEKEVASELKGQIGEWYKAGQITKQQAVDMLTEYFELDRDEITSTVNKWSCMVVTGIPYEDIKDEYLDGNIPFARAVEMYARYGGYTQEKAKETVTKWKAEKETGVVYDEIDDAFMSGEISAADARNMYVTYGGYSKEDAAEKVAVMAFKRDYPELSERITYTQYKRWETDGKPHGVNVETFTKVAEYRGGDGSGSVKSQDDVAAYINALPITKAQKDALWCCFWKQSTLKNAPWNK